MELACKNLYIYHCHARFINPVKESLYYEVNVIHDEQFP